MVVGNGNGISYQVGINCEEIKNFTCNINLTIKDFLTYQIEYNNSVYGNSFLAATQNLNNTIFSQNKYFNFQWQITQNIDTGEFRLIGNHTKKCQKNSLAIIEIIQITPEILASNNLDLYFDLSTITKYKNDSTLDKKIKSIINKNFTLSTS
jgi:hypothetical protein